MLEGRQEVNIPDYNKKNDVKMVINWSPLSEDKVKIAIGDKEAVIAREDLYAFMFTIASPKQQEELLPIRQTTIRKYMRQHRVKVKETVEKGREVVFNCEISVPVTVEEGLRNWFKNKEKRGIVRV